MGRGGLSYAHEDCNRTTRSGYFCDVITVVGYSDECRRIAGLGAHTFAC